MVFKQRCVDILLPQASLAIPYIYKYLLNFIHCNIMFTSFDRSTEYSKISSLFIIKLLERVILVFIFSCFFSLFYTTEIQLAL